MTWTVGRYCAECAHLTSDHHENCSQKPWLSTPRRPDPRGLSVMTDTDTTTTYTPADRVAALDALYVLRDTPIEALRSIAASHRRIAATMTHTTNVASMLLMASALDAMIALSDYENNPHAEAR